MRLTSILLKWPKKRPHGQIWIGKDRMVGKLYPWMKSRMERDVEREKNNLFYCVNPAVSIEAEDAYFKYINETGPRPSDVWWKLKQAKIESTYMAPIPLSDHYEPLNRHNKFTSD